MPELALISAFGCEMKESLGVLSLSLPPPLSLSLSLSVCKQRFFCIRTGMACVFFLRAFAWLPTAIRYD
jgi:hypothetical protein